MKNLAQLALIALVLLLSTACQSTSAANAGEAATKAELRNTLWILTRLDGHAVQTAEAQPTASLTLNSEDARARIVTACNSGSAGYATSANSLKFTVTLSTKMGCPEEQTRQESAFFKVISDTSRYEIKGETLELYDADNKLLATFRSEVLK